jgi:hypothetical protein
MAQDRGEKRIVVAAYFYWKSNDGSAPWKKWKLALLLPGLFYKGMIMIQEPSEILRLPWSSTKIDENGF